MSTKRIVLVHGIHASADKGSIHAMANDFRDLGYDVREYAYPSRWAFQLYSKRIRAKDGAGLFRFCESDGSEILVTHSNGSLVAQNAFKQGLSVDQWFSFGGACTSDGMFYTPENFNYAYSIYNPFDVALKYGAWLPGHEFGRLGSEGYRGAPDGSFDERWKNITGSSTGWGLQHSHYASEERCKWVELVGSNIAEPRSQLSIDRR